METHNFDGIDLDYEFPVADDKDNFGLFVKELREGLGDKYELTAATSATPSKIAGIFEKVSKLAFVCTYRHISNFDFFFPKTFKLATLLV